jgi:hypothetical protein
MQDITHPLSELPILVRAMRGQNRPSRLVLRNTERVGLVHLYFVNGSLVHVEGHRGPGAESLADVATWEQGVIRNDPLVEPPAASQADHLEAALATVLQRLGQRGVTPVSRPSLPHAAASGVSEPYHAVPRPPYPLPPSLDPFAVSGLPPLPPVQEDARAPVVPVVPVVPVAPVAPPTPAMPVPDTLTDPQWQLLALAVHQVVERAGREVKRTVAEGLLAQALAALAGGRRFLTVLEVDTTGWLRPRQEGVISAYGAAEVVEAIAELLAEFERRCAVIVGATRARTIVVEGCLPFRVPLAQIGLDIAVP